ncbi:hypothetical protein ABTM63_19970, partial [Acinetobacter baumannii]
TALFDSQFAFASDVAWFFTAKDLGIVIDILPEVLLHRRIHDSNMSYKLEALHKEYLSIIHASLQRRRMGSGASCRLWMA